MFEIRLDEKVGFGLSQELASHERAEQIFQKKVREVCQNETRTYLSNTLQLK